MVEEGKVAWKEVIRNFYPDLDEAVKIAEKELESVKIEDEVTDVICEECGRNMVIKYGPHGDVYKRQTLMTQIEEGYACDLFFSAAQKQMDQLENDGFLRCV